MEYNFDEHIDRRNSGCYKWDLPKEEGVIPMWVADMDFRVAQPIIDALHERVEHGVFGYVKVPECYYESVINWFDRKHGWRMERDWMQYTIGVVPAISAIIKALTKPGDKVIVQTPVYNCFFSSIRNNDCEVVESPLVLKRESGGTGERRNGETGERGNGETGERENGGTGERENEGAIGDFTYEIDFEDFEEKCKDPKAKLFILCNPHNPAGRVWTKEELERMNTICKRHDVLVVADEIHCELVMPGYHYTPFASVSDDCLHNSITCNSPSKSFNIAGLQMANIICINPMIRRRIDRAININETCDVNPFGYTAAMAAYDKSEDWLEQLNDYIWKNYQYLYEYIHQHLPQLSIARLEGTYLAWVDIQKTAISSDELTKRLLEEGKVMVSSGTIYGQTDGKGFIRLNLACPKSQLEEALKRIKKVVED